MIDQEAETVAASVLHLLTQRGKDVENWRAQAEDWKAVADRHRGEVERLAGALGECQKELAREQGRTAYWHKAYLTCVSSDNAPPTITPLEDTRGVVCPRCGGFLNNVSPGISVVAGGIDICTTCLRPGESEIARAR